MIPYMPVLQYAVCMATEGTPFYSEKTCHASVSENVKMS